MRGSFFWSFKVLSCSWIRQLNAVFCTNHLGQKELQKSLDAPSGCACVFL
ncbi:MAG: hypothetical protein GKR87_10200 [Kiritimatiellae bacterium]|nr:hypothetical protein [Kiritimatiellia bacterium]